MFVNQLTAEGMMEMVDESEVQSRATQQLINVFRESVAKQQELAHMLMGVIRAEVVDCDIVDGLGSAHLFALASIFDSPVDVISCNICWMCNVFPCMLYLCLIAFGPVHNCSS